MFKIVECDYCSGTGKCQYRDEPCSICDGTGLVFEDTD